MTPGTGLVRTLILKFLLITFLGCLSGLALGATFTVSFQTDPAPYTVGTGPFFTVAAPLRSGSTLRDIIVANSDINGNSVPGNTISILLNNGNGTFTQAPGSPITVGSAPVGIAVGDFNGDGKPDIAVANAGSNTISILLGKGDGTFQAPSTIAVGSNPLGLYAADLNGDKKLDLVVMNSDLFDKATPCAHSSISVLLGSGNGTFTPASGSPLASGACPAGAAVVDLGNGHLDLVVANNGGMKSTTPGSVSVFLGNGNGTFKPKVDYTVGVNPIFVAVGDFGNGHQDVAAGDGGDMQHGGTDPGGISILLGNGTGTLSAAPPISNAGGAFFVGAGDINGDGKTDLIVTSHKNGVSILFGNGNGTFQAPVIYSVPGKEGAAAIQDLNGDGKPDLVIPDGKGNTVTVLLNNGNGTFPAPRAYPVGDNPQAIAIGPLRTGSTKLDIVTGNGNFCGNGGSNVTCTSPNLGILLGNGDGTFTLAAGVSTLPATQTSSVAIADLNGDGKPDLVEAENTASGSGAVRVVQGNGNGTFGGVTTINPGSMGNPFAVTAADFNGDNKFDFAATNFQSTVGVALNKGTPGQPISGSTFPSVSGFGSNIGFPTGIAAAKLDGFSTQPDLVLAENGQFCQPPGCTNQHDAVAVLLNSGGGAFSTEFDLTAGTFPRAVVAGRFKNSSTIGLDIAVVNAGSNNISIFLNNGDITGASPFNSTADHTYAVGPLGTNPQSIAVGDFNNDGNLDLVVANPGPNNCNSACPPGTIDVFLGNGDGSFNPPIEIPVLGSPQAVGVGDFNGDGFPDIAVTDQNGNLVTILLNTSGSAVKLTSSLNPSTYGQPVKFTATVTPRVGNGTPTGTVTFNDNGVPIAGGANVAMVARVATFTTNVLTGGSHVITAAYSGDNNFAAGVSAPLPQIVNPVTSSTALGSAPNPSSPGQSVMFTATVTPLAGTGPTGVVMFKDGATSIGTGTVGAGGVATFATSLLAIGSHPITAVYGGDGNFNGSTSTMLTQVVQAAATSTHLVSSANPSPLNQSVTFTATVTSPAGTPTTGAVTFEDGGSPLGAAVAVNGSGIATFSTTTLTAGSHPITAVYGASANFAGSTSNTLDEIITNATGATPSTTVMTITITPARLGEPANTVRLQQTLRFAVNVSGGGATPTGMVVLQDNGVTIGTQTLDGSGNAVFNQRGAALGTHFFGVIFTGNSTYAPSSFLGSGIFASPKGR